MPSSLQPTERHDIIVQYYTNGNGGGGCPNPRTTTVTYQCNAALSVDTATSFSEPTICNYALTIQTPRVWCVSGHAALGCRGQSAPWVPQV